MTKFEKKLIGLLTDPDLTDSQFHEAASALVSGKFRRLVQAADELRRHMRLIFGNERDDSIDEELYSRIEAMLLKEAEIKVPEALKLLANELGREERFPAKVSFRSGLTQLLRNDLDPSRLLSAASRVREQKRGANSRTEWPLKE